VQFGIHRLQFFIQHESQEVAMDAVASLTLHALSEGRGKPLMGYGRLLRTACAKSPPPYGEAWYGEKYRAVGRDPSWLAQSLIANAQKEGDGARKLWILASRARDPKIAEKVRIHAIDESRHSALYLRMLDITFPGAVGDDLRPLLKEIPPGYTVQQRPARLPEEPDDEVLDELIQMNIGEIRTRIHQLLLRPVITVHCERSDRARLERILDSILWDETKHIRYTAELIESAIAAGETTFVRSTMRQRLEEFNEITLKEVQGPDFE
jgi:hypothetical protein